MLYIGASADDNECTRIVCNVKTVAERCCGVNSVYKSLAITRRMIFSYEVLITEAAFVP